MNRTVKLTPGDGTLTRRILKRCRSAGIEVETTTRFTKYGPQIEAYCVPQDIHDEEAARRDAEMEAKRAEQQQKLQQVEEACRQSRIDELSQRFPHLDADIIDSLAINNRTVLSPEKTGYQHGIATKTYWNKLGFRVTGPPAGVVVRGKRLFDVYCTRCLRPNRSKLTVDELEKRWMLRYGKGQLLLAHTLRIANKLQKVWKHPDVYSFKDRWITNHQSYLLDGRVTRVENRMCWDCDGTGTDSDCYGEFDDVECETCNGTGVWSARTLYEHRFEIEGRQFVFHSYIRPRVVSDELGTNAPVYGRPFDKAELPLPPQEIVVTLLKTLMLKD